MKKNSAITPLSVSTTGHDGENDSTAVAAGDGTISPTNPLDKLLIDTREGLVEGASKTGLIDRENDIEYKCKVYNTNPSQMTTSRLVARFLSKFSFYNPYATATNSSSDEDTLPPSLDQAWAYYEHVTLARYYTDENINISDITPISTTANDVFGNNNKNKKKQQQKQKQNKDMYVRAQAGDNTRPTKLYPIWKTPVKELDDFGISIRLYFSTLLVISAYLFIAGLLNLPLFVYYFSSWYDSRNKIGIAPVIKGSAICTETEWVQCNSCFDEDYTDADNNILSIEYPSYRIDYENNRILKNVCNFDNFAIPGIVSFISTILLIGLFVREFCYKQSKVETMFDEEKQTPSDYSIKITNPPIDATDPNEWKEFLQIFCTNNSSTATSSGITLISVCLNNAKLIKTLIQRRRVIKKLQWLLPPLPHQQGTTNKDKMIAIQNKILELNDNFCSSMGCWNKFKLSQINSTYEKLQKIEEEIKIQIRRENYSPTSIYVTFETEQYQRNALHILSTGKYNIWHQNKLRVLEEKKQKKKNDQYTSNDYKEFVVYESNSNTNATIVGVDDGETGCNVIKTPYSCIEEFQNEEEEVEMAQRTIKLNITKNDGKTDDNNGDFLFFRGNHVVDIKEAEEPNNVRWNDIQVSSRTKFVQRLVTHLLLLVLIVCSGYAIWYLEENNPGKAYAALFITVTNILVPKIFEFINNFESHSTDGGRQSSLYVKIAIFRWFNSAVATCLITSFINTISVDLENPDGHDGKKRSLAYEIYPIIFAEIATIPIMKTLDIMGNIRKHILAPRARTQEEMNSYFIGSKFELAERYTDATKVLFVSLFYSTILPEALFLGSIALMIHFISGKFCLLRIWRPSADVGLCLAKLCRNYFLPITLIVHVVMSSYWWSGFPYDNVCLDGASGKYKPCNQDMFSLKFFPPLPTFQKEQYEEYEDGVSSSSWMTSSQALVTSLYGWSASLIVVLAALTMFHYILYPAIESIFKSTYEPDGKDQGIDFSSLKQSHEIAGYIPQYKEIGFTHPLLACDIQNIDHDFIGWYDRLNGFESHNLFNDAIDIMGQQEFEKISNEKPIFSIVKHWPFGVSASASHYAKASSTKVTNDYVALT